MKEGGGTFEIFSVFGRVAIVLLLLRNRVIKSHTAVVVCLIAVDDVVVVAVVVPLTLSFFRLSYPLHAIVFCSSLGSVNWKPTANGGGEAVT